nr:ATP/GTP-binding protein [Thermosphaera aggregans]
MVVKIPYYIIVLGTAGSGKTTLTSMLMSYLDSHQMDVATVNLDPAVEDLPYNPDVDIREWVDAREVMAKQGLGPNGALIASVDMLALNISELKDQVDSLRSNYVIIDTPGQLEIFAFRDSGPVVLRTIIGDSKAVSLFLIDGLYAVKPSNLFSAMLLSASTFFRIKYPQINVFTKIDLLSEAEYSGLLSMIESPEELASRVVEDAEANLMWSSEEVYSLAEKLYTFESVSVSNNSGQGFDDLYASIQRVVAGGEDYFTEEPNPLL